MFSGLTAQRLAALFIGGWVLLDFPLLALWDRDVMIAGVPLFPAAIFTIWAVLIALIGCAVERATDD